MENLDGDSIMNIISSLDAPSLLQVQVAARWAHETARQNRLWRQLCDADLGLLPPSDDVAVDDEGTQPKACWSLEPNGTEKKCSAKECYWLLRRKRSMPLGYAGTITDGGMDAADVPSARGRVGQRKLPHAAHHIRLGRHVDCSPRGIPFYATHIQYPYKCVGALR